MCGKVRYARTLVLLQKRLLAALRCVLGIAAAEKKMEPNPPEQDDDDEHADGDEVPTDELDSEARRQKILATKGSRQSMKAGSFKGKKDHKKAAPTAKPSNPTKKPKQMTESWKEKDHQKVCPSLPTNVSPFLFVGSRFGQTVLVHWR